MKLDKHTYGKTPAAIYLADRLNSLGSSRVASKVGKRLTELRVLIGELLESNKAGTLSAHSIGALLEHLTHRVHEAKHSFLLHDDSSPKLALGSCSPEIGLILNLMCNVMHGEIKSLHRKVTDARHREQLQTRLIGRAKEPSEKFKLIEQNVAALGTDWCSTKLVPKSVIVDYIADPITPESLIKKSKTKLKRQGKRSELY